MHKKAIIYIAGHKGMVGSAIWKTLKNLGYINLIGRTSNELDLRNQENVFKFTQKIKPDVIINAAAVVGGIFANNKNPYQFLMHNMLIQNNLIQAAHENDVKKFVFLGSSCIYPKFSKLPITEESLLKGSLEPTNQWYAIAKITGVKLCEAIRNQYHKDFISLMPTNLYGPNDNFNLKTSHVVPAMIRKFHEAKLNNHAPVILWGNGEPFREFLYVDDLAKAVVFSIENILPDHLYNIGSGSDISIKKLSQLIQKIIGHKGSIIWDVSKPNGTPRKLMDSSKINQIGWTPKISLEDGIENTYKWFCENNKTLKQISIS